MATANARVHVTIMLETKRAFDRLDEIAAVPGIDALTLGPTDLAQDLGVLGTPSQRDVVHEHRQRLVQAARKHGTTVAMLTDGVAGAPDDRARRDDHQLFVGCGGASLELRGRRRGDPPHARSRQMSRIYGQTCT
jgi:citrate lyase beta subunit